MITLIFTSIMIRLGNRGVRVSDLQLRHVRRADFLQTVFRRKSYEKWQGNRVFVGLLLH